MVVIVSIGLTSDNFHDIYLQECMEPIFSIFIELL